MKKHFNKEYNERYRAGKDKEPTYSKKLTLFEDGQYSEDTTYKNKISKKLGWDSKGYRPRHNYSLITNFLRMNIGKKWDDVWSEICKNNDSRTYVGKCIRQQFLWSVELNTFEKDGKIFYMDRWYGERELKYRNKWRMFYVCPKTKVLKYI